jgi:hypothetical protein
MADEDRPYDAGDPKDVKAAIKAAQRWDDKRDNVVKSIMSSEDGRRWIREFLELCHVGASSFSIDALRMAYLEGERNVGTVFMANVMNAAPDLYMLMMAEANPTPEQKDESNG